MFIDNLEEKHAVNERALGASVSTLKGMMEESDGSGNNIGQSRFAIDAILKHYNIEVLLPDRDFNTLQDVEDFLKTCGVLCNRVELAGKWWKSARGPVLASDKNNNLIAMMPSGFGYKMLDFDTGKQIRVTEDTVSMLRPTALNFFRYMSRNSMTLKDFYRFCFRSIGKGDLLIVLIFCLVTILLEMIVPIVNKLMFNDVIPSGVARGILPICGMLLAAGISSIVFKLCRDHVLVRVRDQINANVQPALMARLLNLPLGFFKKYSAGELSTRVMAVNNVYQLFTNSIISIFATCLFSVMYIFIAILYAKELVVVVTLIFLYAIYNAVTNLGGNVKKLRKAMPYQVSSQDFTYNAIQGIQKIKNNRAEYRVFNQWANRFSKSQAVFKIFKFKGVLHKAIGTFLVYLIAYNSEMAVSDFIAFMTAFTIMIQSINEFNKTHTVLSSVAPTLDLIKPILEEKPEMRTDLPHVTNISGSIDINHIYFRYNDKSPWVLNDVSLHIDQGENVGFVGASGCGKSTLMRILLGFDKPVSGSIFYGQYNVDNVNLNSLRQYVGFCPQTLQIFPGTIAENIRFASENCTDEEVWEAAELACIADDIRNKPDGMETMLGEGGSGLSGGQAQRLLIARAVLNKPRVLFMDEATSALDNITQKKVVENLGKIGCTRISIAHRLSTVMNCDKIVVLDKGRLIEVGSPQELLKSKGFFYQLTLRQQ